MINILGVYYGISYVVLIASLGFFFCLFEGIQNYKFLKVLMMHAEVF